MQLRLYLFGMPRIERNGKLVELNLRKGLALLVYLVVTRQSHSRDMLATLLWPEKDQQTARANLRRILYELGQLLGSQVLEVVAERVALSTHAPLWLDIEQFQSGLAEDLSPNSALQDLDTPRLMRLVEVANFYTADFMAGFTLRDCPEFDDWQFFQREELRSAFATLLEQLVLAHEVQEKWEEALHYARRWLALDPLAEPIHRRLMQLYAQAGQSGAALRQYEECVRILAEEFDAPPEEETTALQEAIRTRRFPVSDRVVADRLISDRVVASKVAMQQIDKATMLVESVTSSPLQPVAPLSSNNLPTRTTAFIGRQQELSELLRRLRDPHCRLLTLVGPGGIGKTRIAIEAAQAILGIDQDSPSEILDAEHSQFKDGSFFVSLQPINTHSGVVSAIAGVLGLQFYSSAPPQQQLLQFLHEKELLLVLDNFEHLLGGADLVAEILEAAPGVKMLVTSREALKLHEEWFHPLAGMRLPPVMQTTPGKGARSSQETITGYDAVQLFIQTARRALVTFEPESQLDEIVRICRLVDGMPLGIELAASWLKVLSCTQIAHEIERNIDILVARHQNVPVRHRSMRVVMAHSWQLLTQETQDVLQRLSVFRGGFLQDAAAVVAGADLLTLADLVDKSWIYHTPDGRYQMHELLRQYAADCLAQTTIEESETRERHATFYLRQIGQRESALLGPEQRTALDEFDAESDNIQAAWARAAMERNLPLIDTAMQGLYSFLQTRSRYAESEELFAQALSHLENRTSTLPVSADETGTAQIRLRLLARLGNFHLYQADLEAADSCFTTVLNNSQDPRELAFVYLGLGQSARIRGDRPAAEAALQQSLTLARRSDNRHQMAETLKVLSDVASSWADFAEGKRLAKEALVLCQQLQHPDLTAKVLAGLAWATNCLGGYAESEKHYRESLAIFEAIGTPYGIALATNFLGWVAFCKGGDHVTEALPLYGRALAIWRQIGQRSNLARCLSDYALAAGELGDYDTALRCAQEGLAIIEELNHPNFVSYNYYCVGAAMCGQHEFVESQTYLSHSLQTASKAQLSDNICAALYFQAQLFIKESNLLELSTAKRLEKQVQALELLSLVIHHRSTWQLFRDRALRVQAKLTSEMPADIVTAAMERGQRRTLHETVAKILNNEP